MIGSRVRTRVRALVAAAAATAAAIALAGCATQSRVDPGSEVVVAVDGAFTSANPSTTFGDTRRNADVAYLTGSPFGIVDAAQEVVPDEFLGRAEIVDDAPFTVRYSVADDAVWSDGIAIDGADLLVSWAAASHAVDDPRIAAGELVPADHLDAATGAFTGLPDDAAFFDGPAVPGIQPSSRASVDPGGRSLTVRFGDAFPGWRLAIQPTVPAHVLGAIALGDAVGGTAEAKRAVSGAIRGRTDDLVPITRTWNEAWNLAGMPEDERLLVTSGPYRVADVVAGESVTLVANERYRGSRRPVIETLRLVAASSPEAAVAMVRDGQADVAAPDPTAPAIEVAASIDDETGISVERGVQSSLQMVELRAEGGRSGVFADADARRAFLTAIPRDSVVDRAVGSADLDADALDSFVFQPRTPAYDRAQRDNGSARFEQVDRERARAMLAASSVAAPAVCLLYDRGDARHLAAFEVISDAVAQVGFTVEDCGADDPRALLGTPGAYDAAIVEVPTSLNGVVDVASRWGAGGPLNTSGYASDELDALIADERAAGDDEARDELLREIDAALWADAAGVPLFALPSLAVVGPGIENAEPSPLPTSILWNAWDWQRVPVEVEPGEDAPQPEPES